MRAVVYSIAFGNGARTLQREHSMVWAITDEVIRAYETAEEHDSPTKAAYDRLWARISLDPAEEGAALDGGIKSGDLHMRRVFAAIAKIDLPDGVLARVAYEPIEGPSNAPPWLAFAIYVVDWKPGTHLLLAIGRVDRHGKHC